MAASFSERYGERESGIDSERRVYIVRGVTTSDAARDHMITNAPSISGLSLSDVTARELHTDGDGSTVSDGIYIVSVTWGARKFITLQQVGEIRTWSRASTELARLLTSRSTVSSQSASWFTTIDFGGLVNVDSDGNVEGVDVPIPVVTFGIDAVLATSSVTDVYEVAVHSLVGTLNSATYRGRAARTLLCTGANFSYGSDDTTNLTLEFKFSPHVTGLTIGSITGIAKEAHDYLWVHNVLRKGDNGLVAVPAQVNVERFFTTSDFAAVIGF